MLTAYFTAAVSMMILLCFWLAVQRLWQRYFPERASEDDDALANRSGCHGCSCDAAGCEREKAAPTQ